MLDLIIEAAAAAAEAIGEAAEAAAEAGEVAAEAGEVTAEGAEIAEASGELGNVSPELTSSADGLEYFRSETMKERAAEIGAKRAEEFERELPEELEACNPNYELGECWQINCQRCVPTYEMRMRGYDVTANKCEEYFDYLAINPFDVWVDPEVIQCEGNGLEQIKAQMAEWGDGARAQIVVSWEGTGSGGHTFVAEQVDGETRFFDPQTHETHAESYFDMVESGSVRFCRMDQLAVNEDLIKECCREV